MGHKKRNIIMNKWHEESLGSIATVVMGQSPASSSYDAEGRGILFLQGKADFSSDMKKIIPRQWTSEPTKIAEAGDILFTVRAPVGEVGKTDQQCCIGRGLAAIRNNEKSVQNFLFYYLQNASDVFQRLSQGSTFTAVNSDDVRNLTVLLPSKNEQEKIAEILSAVDEDIEKTDAVIAKTENLKKGLMQQLLSKGIGHTKLKKTKLGEIPEEWKVVRLADIVNIVNGKTPLRANAKFWDNGTISWFTIDDVWEQGRKINKTKQCITEKALKETGIKLVPSGSTLLCCTASIGEYAYADIPITTNQQFNALYPKDLDKLDTVYLYYVAITLGSKLLKIRGATTFGFVSMGTLGDFEILLPPLTEQKKISTILSFIDEKISTTKKNKEKLHQLKKGLMTDLLSGARRIYA
ncbi:MAG: restriction endonuclease subunit S [Patescibacteria group bacterium]